MSFRPSGVLRPIHVARLVFCLALCGFIGALPLPVDAEGSRNLYPVGANGFRSNLEWRNSSYGGRLLRRTLLKVYANAGEYILLGSSAVDVPDNPDRGDIRLFKPGLVKGAIGAETIPSTPSFSCLTQRAQTNNLAQGRIASRVQEMSGPDTIINTVNAQPGNAVAGGYVPCFYLAQTTGVYDIVFWGPRGDNRDDQTKPTGSIDNNPDNFNAAQDTSISAWDVTVRSNLTSTTDISGRLFAYYLGMFTGDNGRPINSTIYVVCRDGYMYRVDLSGMDPNGYVLYANNVGFLDSDGKTPLYHDVLSEPALTFEEQNQLTRLQGGTKIAPPQFPIFFALPDPAVLIALDIPTSPVASDLTDFTFSGSEGSNVARVGEGGTFSFVSTGGGVYQIVISNDGTNFDPTEPSNRVLRGVLDTSGATTAPWDGRDNTGKTFLAGKEYQASMAIHGGEFHFPFLDVENSLNGSPHITMLNPPGGICPLWNGDCNGVLYDDRGYRTANGTVVGMGVNGTLCPNNEGNPPQPLYSDPIYGVDSSSTQRGFGFKAGGNPPSVCDPIGGFGDKKGLDLWTYYPSKAIATPLLIVAPTAISLQHLTVTPQGNTATVRWQTATERSTWGFHILRSATSNRDDAERITSSVIRAQGRGGSGASYSWTDTNASASIAYSYWLQEVELDGTVHEYGPVKATPETTAVAKRILLPIVTK